MAFQHAVCLIFLSQELRWTDHAPVVLTLQLPPTAADQLRPAAADSALLAAHQVLGQQLQQQQQQEQEQQANAAAGPAAGSTAIASQLNAAAAPSAGVTATRASTTGSATRSAAEGLTAAPMVAAIAATGAGFPCALSTHWLMQPQAAAEVASAMLAAAGISRAPPEVLTCSILQQLRHSQYAAATHTIRSRAQQLYQSEEPLLPASQAGLAAAAHYQQLTGVAASSPGRHTADARGELEGGHETSVSLQSAAAATSAAVAAAAVAAGGGGAFVQATSQGGVSPPAAQPSGSLQQRQHQPRKWHARGQSPRQQQHTKQMGRAAGRAAGSKRKGRGWKVVDIGNGCTATVACSSSEDSD